MRRGIIVLALALALSAPAAARAETLEERVIRQLDSQGYSRIWRTRTLLGRVRIIGLREGKLREIVIDPSTSEILRDLELRSDRIPDIPPLERPGDGG